MNGMAVLRHLVMEDRLTGVSEALAANILR